MHLWKMKRAFSLRIVIVGTFCARFINCSLQVIIGSSNFLQASPKSFKSRNSTGADITGPTSTCNGNCTVFTTFYRYQANAIGVMAGRIPVWLRGKAGIDGFIFVWTNGDYCEINFRSSLSITYNTYWLYLSAVSNVPIYYTCCLSMLQEFTLQYEAILVKARLCGVTSNDASSFSGQINWYHVRSRLDTRQVATHKSPASYQFVLQGSE